MVGRNVLLTVVLLCLSTIDTALSQNQSILYNNQCIQHVDTDNPCNMSKETIRDNRTNIKDTNKVINIIEKDIGYVFSFSLNVNPSPDVDINSITVTELNLCYEEALKLTASDLKCGEVCSINMSKDFSRAIVATCNDNTILDGNWILLLFSPQAEQQSCVDNYVLIDVDDVNECLEVHNCSQNAECVDETCGYSCKCQPGYHFGEDNYTCLLSDTLTAGFEQPSYTFYETGPHYETVCAKVHNQLNNFESISGTVKFSILPNTTQEDDYIFASDGVLMMFNVTTALELFCIDIAIINDNVSECVETMTLFVTLEYGTHLFQNKTEISIKDNYGFARVPLSVSALLNAERNISFSCSSEEGHPAFSVEWKLNGDTIQSRPHDVIITHSQGATSSTISLPPIFTYYDATVACLLASENGTVLISDTARVHLQYATLTLDSDYYTVLESDGTVAIRVTVVDSNLPDNFSSISFTTTAVPGSAKENIDFYGPRENATLHNVTPGSWVTLTVEIVDDLIEEESETFRVNLSATYPGVLFKLSSATVAIIDNDANTGCPRDVDSWSTEWSESPKDSTMRQPCPPSYDGYASRYCNMQGKWERVNFTDCASDDLFDLEREANEAAYDDSLDDGSRSMKLNDVVQELIQVTDPQEQTIIPPALNIIVRSLNAVTDTLQNTNISDLRVIEIFNNLLDQRQGDNWSNLLSDGNANSSEILLDSVERYAIALTSDNKTSITQSRANIVVKNQQHTEPPSIEITFPNSSDLVNYTKSETSSSIRIPTSLVQERMEESGGSLPISFILLRNFPTTNQFEHNSVVVTPEVISAKVGTSSMSLESPALLEDPVVMDFDFQTIGSKSSHICAFWNFSQPVGSGGWISDGVTTQCVSTADNQTAVKCTSTHLTSFAVLVDVTGALGKVAPQVKLALDIVSYIGCAVSIVCLTITVIFFLLQGKKLFEKAHHFVHLNLAISLLLANTVFVIGVQLAAQNDIACAFVAALLHYLFLSAFCWMLCEGIMLYLLLVVVFGNTAHKLWLFMAIGYLLPMPVVITTVGVRYQHYGVKDNCGNLLYCWLSTKQGTIYGFIGPMVAVILVNIFFLLMALRVLWNSKRQQLQRSKENKHTSVKTARAVLLASVVLLPLLGLTWLFGLFSVNENTIVFAWLFTIFNSLQGAFIFFFHVLRSEPVQAKIASRIHTMSGTLRSRYTTTSKWYSSENSTSVLGPGRNSVKTSGVTNVTAEEAKVTDNEEGQYQVQMVMSEPTVEVAHADGGAMTERQIQLTRTHKMTYMKLSQLLNKTGELLATHQDEPEEIMEVNDINGASARGVADASVREFETQQDEN